MIPIEIDKFEKCSMYPATPCVDGTHYFVYISGSTGGKIPEDLRCACGQVKATYEFGELKLREAMEEP